MIINAIISAKNISMKSDIVVIIMLDSCLRIMYYYYWQMIRQHIVIVVKVTYLFLLFSKLHR